MGGGGEDGSGECLLGLWVHPWWEDAKGGRQCCFWGEFVQSLTVGNGRGGKCVVSVVSGQRKHWYLRCDCFCSQCGSRNTGTYVVVVSVVSAAAETLVLQAMGVSVDSAAAETLVLQAVGETHIVSAAAETLLQAVGLLVPLPWL